MALISVIIPVYNVEKHLPRCIESILEQTFTDFELILVDDGSSDNCPAICDEYAKKDSRIKVIHQTNQGVSAARNTGIKAAEGEYISFCDSDDFVSRYYLEKLYAPENDLNICGCYFTSQDGKITDIARAESYSIESVSSEKILHWFERGSLYSVWSALFRRSLVVDNALEFTNETSRGEDTIFMLKYVSVCKNVRFISDILYYYVRYHGETLTTSLNVRNIYSLDYIDTYFFNWIKENSYKSEVFENPSYWTHQEIYTHFVSIFMNSNLSLKEKAKHYRAIWQTNAKKRYWKKWVARESVKLKIMFAWPTASLVILYEIVRRILA